MRRVRSTSLDGGGGAAPEPPRALCSWPGGSVAGQPLPRLTVESVARAYRNSSRRVILLGLDGTLIQQEKVMAHLKLFHDFQGHSMAPPPAVLHCLRALSADPANIIYVISSRSENDMEACLGDIGGLGLAAEDGFLMMPAQPEGSHTQRAWRTILRDPDAVTLPWRDTVKHVLNTYKQRTNGAYVRWQQSAAQFLYHDADPDFGRFQASGLRP